MSEEVVIKDFKAEWCGPCQTQEPILESIEEDNDNVRVNKIDVDENEDIASEYGVRSIPMMVLEYEDGDIIDSFIGVTQQDEIEAALP